MSENTKPTSEQDEVDLGQVFGYIEKVLKKIGKLISTVFNFFILALNKLLVFILFCINIIISKIIPIGIAVILGFGLSFGLSKIFKSYYSSNMIIKQNFNTGNIIYNQVSALNALAKQSDSVALAKELDVKLDVAAQITSFSIEHSTNKNNLRSEYYEFIKGIDSTSRISFEEYTEDKNLEDSPIQTVKVESKNPNVYNGLENALLKFLLNNEYLNQLKENKINELKRSKKTLMEVLSKSDSLQDNYFELLEKYYKVESGKYNSSKADINVNLDSKSKDKVSTKEYDLFISSIKIKEELDKVESELENKKEVIVLQKGFASAEFKEKPIYESTLFFPILLASILFLFFLFKELNFSRALNKYGTKEELFK